jgi:gas vesicle structural protein
VSEIDRYREVTLLELVDRVLDKGVVLSGDVTLAVADVDLIHIELRALLASVATIERRQSDSAAKP